MNVAAGTNLLLPGTARWPLDVSAPVIELIDVSIAFGAKQVLNGLNLKIRPGQITVIAGESGSGKTVLLKLMIGLLRPDRGRILAFGRDLAASSPVELVQLRKRMGMVFQSYALFDALSVEDNVEFALREGSSLSHDAIVGRAHELLHLLGLDGTERQHPAELSGGMKKRLALARALVANPEVVLLDEPTTGLDPIMVEKVDDLIAEATARFQTTSVLVTHDLASMRRLAARVAFLHQGAIAFEGSYHELVESELAPVRTFVTGGSRGSSPHATRSAPVTAPVAPVVELVGVHKDFAGRQVLRGVDLAIPPGKTTFLIGASGSGKSVIVKHIMGLLAPSRGEVRVFGQNLAAMNERELDGLRRRIGFVFQHAALLDWLSVEENVAFPLVERRQTSRAEIRDRVAEALSRLQLGDLGRRLTSQLSVGQRKRVALARAIVSRPEIMIYDEPTTGQDPVRSGEIDDLMRTTQEQLGITSIVISHDLTSVFRIADLVGLLHEGTIAAFGTPAELRGSADEHVQRFLRAGAIAAA